jgi:hypothetical protein
MSGTYPELKASAADCVRLSGAFRGGSIGSHSAKTDPAGLE